MLYKPNFCCHCGEKVERVEWNLLTSRRFCEACSIENRRHDLAPRIAVGAGALALVFGFGTLWGGSGSDERPQSALPATLKSDVSSQTPRNPAPSIQTLPEPPIQNESPAPAFSIPKPAEVTTLERKSPEPVFYCGALTKKGTPCSRKVKARGLRCYQHEGRPQAPPIN